MGKIYSTKWKLEPHTYAKHMILKKYLQAWMPMMTMGYNYNKKAILIDGFAGPGVYENGEIGSPIIMLQEAIDYLHRFPAVTPSLLFIFIEQDESRFNCLHQQITTLFKNNITTNDEVIIPNEFDYMKIFVLNEKFEDVMKELLEKTNGHMAPCFSFIDPFGFKNTPFYLIKKLAENEKSEIFINFMYEFVNRFLALPELQEIYSSLFGTEEWKNNINNLNNFSPKERRFFIHKLYESQLKIIGFKYVSSFEMRNEKNATKYFLYHGTKHIRGLEKMKDAMWSVDRSGEYTFSDYEAYQSQLSFVEFNQPDLNILADLLMNKFHGQTQNCGAVKDFILIDTPFRRNRHPKQAFDILKQRGLLEISGRKRGGYPDYATLNFK